jgi:hypothetical protein
MNINDLHVDKVEVLSDSELDAVLGGGWFKKLTGISTPKFLKDFDDDVREKVPGGWLGVIGAVVETVYDSGGGD